MYIVDNGLTSAKILAGNLAVDLKVPDSIEPSTIFDNSTKSVIVKEGENTQLDCYARGQPALEVNFVNLVPIGFIPNEYFPCWYHGFMRIMNFYSFTYRKFSKWQQRHFNNLQCHQKGSGYIRLCCPKWNRQSQTPSYRSRRQVSTCGFCTEVLYLSLVILLKNFLSFFITVYHKCRQKLKQALFHDVDLDCDVDAYPAPTITWQWNDEMQLITNNEHYK